MILKMREVYRSQSLSSSPTQRMRFVTRDVFINTEHIVFIRPNAEMSGFLAEGLIDDVGPADEAFCTISLSRGSSGVDITVVGSTDEINEKINRKGVLHG